jgi:rod shape-determining protein MreC
MDWELYERYRATLVLIGVALVSFLLLAFQNSSFVRQVRNLMATCTLPLQRPFSPAVPEAPTEDRSLSAPLPLEALSRWALTAGLSAERSRALRLLMEENKQLRELLDLKENAWPSAVAARVISRNPQRWFEEILLDKGSQEGIGVDDPVVTVAGGQEGLVGRVIEIGPHVAKVMLLQDSLSAVAAHLEGAESDDGVVEGNDSADLVLHYVSRDSRIKVGDRVLTSGLGKTFPEGIPIGWVEDVGLGERQLFLQARLRPIISAIHLRAVLVLVRHR